MYRQNDSLYYCPVGDEILVFHEEKQEYFRLNQTGAAIWRMFSNPQTIEDIVGRLRGEFAIDQDACQAEVSQFVSELVQSSFLVAV